MNTQSGKTMVQSLISLNFLKRKKCVYFYVCVCACLRLCFQSATKKKRYCKAQCSQCKEIYVGSLDCSALCQPLLTITRIPFKVCQLISMGNMNEKFQVLFLNLINKHFIFIIAQRLATCPGIPCLFTNGNWDSLQQQTHKQILVSLIDSVSAAANKNSKRQPK